MAIHILITYFKNPMGSGDHQGGAVNRGEELPQKVLHVYWPDVYIYCELI